VLIDERPGITGAATLYFRHEERLLSRQTDPRRYYGEVIYPAKVRMDLAYFRNWSLRRDFYCLLVTSLPFTDRWVHVVPADTLPVQLPDPAPAADSTIDPHAPSERVPSDGFRPAVAVPVRSNGSGTAPNVIPANTNGNGHRPVVAVPVRSNGHASSEPTDLGKRITIKPPTVIHVLRPSVDTAAEDVASPVIHDRESRRAPGRLR
jgi:hypothetical protein